MSWIVQLAKMAALSATVGLLVSHALGPVDAAAVGTCALWLLLSRVS